MEPKKKEDEPKEVDVLEPGSGGAPAGRGRGKQPRKEKLRPVLKRPGKSPPGKEKKKDKKRDGGDREPEKKKKKKKKGKSGDSDEVPEESRQKLKDSLAALKARLTGTRGAKEGDLVGPIEDGSDGSVVPVNSESEPEGLRTGTSMRVTEKKKARNKLTEKPKKMAKEDGRGRTSAAMKALEDTSVGLSKKLQSQLARQALAVSSELKESKKTTGERTSLELARILTKNLKRKGKKEKKDRKEKKAKKKKKKAKD